MNLHIHSLKSIQLVLNNNSNNNNNTLNQALDELMEDVTNSKSSFPQLVKPTVQMEEALSLPPPNAPLLPPTPTQQAASPEKTLDQALDVLMEDVTNRSPTK